MNAGAPVVIGTRTIDLGGESVDYELRRSGRRTLGISVDPEGEIIVTAPAAAEEGRIRAILLRRKDWIRRQRRQLASLPPAPRPREWVSGETHRYLGRQYRLKVTAGDERSVRLIGKFFRVSVPRRDDRAEVQRLMERWYLDHARSTFEKHMSLLISQTPLLRLSDVPPLLVRRLRTRWGSCSPEGRVLMNVDAVKLPVTCIDYLLVHELCHLRVPHHGSAFWRLLDRCMPDWEERRRRLDMAEI